jgi:hypothetical protein
MEKLFESLGAGILLFLLVGLIAVFIGTVVFLIWPVAIPAVFPGLVAAGTIAGKLLWWQAVCFTWLCGILIKSTNSNSSKS